jgi:hypothetical protein
MSPAVARRLALITGLTLGLLVVAGVAFAAVSAAWAAGPESPTVTFNRGSPPRSCGSAPTVTSLTIPENTPLVVINATGREAFVVVGGEPVLPIGIGGGVELVLASGQHDVRVVPECLAFADAQALAVTVTSAPAPASSSAGGPESTTSATAAPQTTAPPAASAPTSSAVVPRPPSEPPPAAPGASRENRSGGESVVVPASAAEAPDEATSIATPRATPSAVVAGVISARPVVLSGEGHAKGLNLLAAIATICVLGVTVAIIRAIVRLSP